MADVYLGLGANTGDPKANLREALRMIGEACELVAVSSLWATEPVGYLEQDWFLNAAAHVRTDWTPEALLAFLQGIEQSMGRQRTIPNGPRTIDLDILLWNNDVIEQGGLIVPHPRMHERLFVLEPLAEIAPDLIVPRVGRSVAGLREALHASRSRVEWLAGPGWHS